MAVQGGDEFQGFGAAGDDRLAIPDTDLLQRLQAVGDEGGTKDDDPFLPRLGKVKEEEVGVRLDPGGPAESGLKRDLPDIGREPEFRRDQLGGPKTLLLVGIPFLNMSLRKAVEAEQDL